MKKTLAVAAALVLGFGASSAFADFQFATTSALMSGNSGADISSGGTDTNGAGQPNGSLITITNSGGGAETAVLRFEFFNTTTSPGLILYSLSRGAGAVTITSVQWSNNAGFGASGAQTAPESVAVAAGPTDLILSVPGGFGISPAFSAAALDHYAFISFSVAAGGTFSIDAVSNPEPGTLALFALGAAGLGGLAWKRRKRAPSRGPAPKSDVRFYSA